MARFCLRCHVRLSVLSSVVMYLPVKSFILMMISSMVLILPAYVNQPKTSKSITLCEYYCIIHLCHHSNFSATLLNQIQYITFGGVQILLKFMDKWESRYFKRGPIVSAFN